MKSLANWITAARIPMSIALFFVEPFGTLFYVLAALCGISDVLDGWVARSTHSVSATGSRLDTVADLTFNLAMLTRIIIYLEMPEWIWIWAGSIGGVRLLSLLLVMIKYKTFFTLHTYGNKLTGLLIFLYPFSLLLTKGIAIACVVCVIATVSAVEELIIHIIYKEPEMERKSLFLPNLDKHIQQMSKKI